jgi:cobalamin biosynthesis protein CobT
MPTTEETDSLAESIREEGDQTEEPDETPESEETEEPAEDETPEEGGEAEAAAGPDETEEAEEETEEAPSRGHNRVEALLEERGRLKAENEALRRSSPPAAGPDQAALTKQRRDFLARNLADFDLLTPEQRAERMDSILDTALRNAVSPLAGELHNTSDRQAFRDQYGPGTKTAKLYSRFEKDIEAQVRDARSKGFNLNRETVFTALCGKALISGQDAALKVAQKGAKQRLVKASGSSPSGKGGAAGKAAKTRVSELEDRLDGVPL